MRTSLLLPAILSFASLASAQDDAATQAMQANQQAIADIERANRQANEQMMREMQANASADIPENNGPVVATGRFSGRPGRAAQRPGHDSRR